VCWNEIGKTVAVAVNACAENDAKGDMIASGAPNPLAYCECVAAHCCIEGVRLLFFGTGVAVCESGFASVVKSGPYLHVTWPEHLLFTTNSRCWDVTRVLGRHTCTLLAAASCHQVTLQRSCPPGSVVPKPLQQCCSGSAM
jgi:hypothetical protein